MPPPAASDATVAASPISEHAVSDEAGQPDRAGEIVIEVDWICRLGLRVLRDLLLGERHLAFHQRITTALGPAALVSATPLVSVSNQTKRIPRRLMSEATGLAR